jgi:DNA-binding transcriptional regulator of glucitol operon
VSTTLITAIMAGLVVAWIAQGMLIMRQARHFQARLRALREHGVAAVGRDGTRLRGYVYVALAADADDRVRAAEAMSGATVFSHPRPAPEFVGRTLGELTADRSTKRERAAAQAAEFILAAPADVRRGKQTTSAGATAPAARSSEEGPQ